VLVDSTHTALSRAVEDAGREHPGETGVQLLARPVDAFAARVALAGAAERSLDIQYYIWNDDRTGQLMFEELWKAAERGVRVRLLLDDLSTTGRDRILSALDAHPNIEVRLYNPIVQRRTRWLAYLTDFGRLNRRMHNKSFTVDNTVSILGGRNIGDEYFGLGEELLFADLDVVVAGAVVSDVSAQFDAYWNSESSYPAAQLVRAASEKRKTALLTRFAAVRAESASVAYIRAAQETPLVANLASHRPVLQWSVADLVHDDPEKTTDGLPREESLLFPEMMRAAGRPLHAIDLVSPYFVPMPGGTATLASLVENGVQVRVLTNSLAATDVAAVHAGYVKWRRKLLKAGVQLYEFHPAATQSATPPVRSGRSGSGFGGTGFGGSGSRAPLGLHAKTFAVDSARLFIGSFNFDPRSALLNTELGIVIHNPSLARQLHREFDDLVPQMAYEVLLGPGGRGLQWIELTPSGEIQHRSEPDASLLRRFYVSLLRMLPLDWLL
jgi:cardiolipin synthase C